MIHRRRVGLASARGLLSQVVFRDDPTHEEHGLLGQVLVVVEPRAQLWALARLGDMLEYGSDMEVSTTREIRRPAEEVFAFFSDATNNPMWQEGMRSCRWTSEPPIDLGSTYEQRARFLGRDVISTFVVTDYQPPHLIEIETLKSTFPIKVIRRVEATGAGSSRVSADISGGPEGGLLKVLEPLIGGAARRSIERDYDRLVQLLESSASSDSTENSPQE